MVLKQSINISDNGFLFDSATGDSYSVNATGLEIIKLLKEGKTEEQIRVAMDAMFGVDSLTLERNLFEFTNLLTHLNLLAKDATKPTY